MTRFGALLTLGVAIATLAACGAEGSTGVTETCGSDRPNECRTPEGQFVGCCPTAHPVCSPDGKSCIDFASGGSGGGDTGGTGATSTTGGAGGVGASGGTGGMAGATGGAAGTAATGGTGASCDDPNEPDEDETTARYLGAIDDCNGSGATVTGVLDGKTDVDWLRFYGSDTFGCVVDPVGTSSIKARVCLFADCPSAQVSCSGSAPASSPAGRPGCCAPQGGQISLSLGCNGIDDSATIYIRVDTPTQNACLPYSLDYHY
jgi:hypothetical protein